MPRNVVSLRARRLARLRGANRERRQAIVAGLEQRYRVRRREDADMLEIDFPPSLGRRQAKAEVAAELDRIDARWRRLFVLYPSESSLRG